MGEGADLPLIAELFLSVPLYRLIDLTSYHQEKDYSYWSSIKAPQNPVDCYCVECRRSSTFKGYQTQTIAVLGKGSERIDARVAVVEFRCTRDESHRMYFVFALEQGNMARVIKIGQYPSIADLSTHEIRQYRKVLSDEKYKELSKAIGLASHGVGIGAFVYLRRIFEDLIEEAHREARQVGSEREGAPSWDEELYKRARMEERIEMLAEFLPSFLVENRGLYSILSKGIHELSEDECLKHFYAVRVGIELILDEELEQLKRQEKIKRAKKDLGLVHQELSAS